MYLLTVPLRAAPAGPAMSGHIRGAHLKPKGPPEAHVWSEQKVGVVRESEGGRERVRLTLY